MPLHRLMQEHDSPTHASRRDVHAQLIPILKMGALVQKQMIEYRSLITAEELEGSHPELAGKYEHIHQTFAAIDRDVTSLMNAGRALMKATSQLDTYLETVRNQFGNTTAAPGVGD